MARVKKRSYNNDTMSTINSLYDQLQSIGVPVTVSGSVATITPQENLVITINSTKIGYWTFQINITVNGSSVVTNRNIAQFCTVYAVYSENIFHLYFTDSRDGYRCGIFYEKIQDVGYYGVMTTNGSGYYSVTDYSLTKLSNPVVGGYTHSNMINYSTQTNTVHYLDYAGLFIGGIFDSQDPNLRACVGATTNTCITLDGQNYYVIGTNLLVPLDD